MNIRDGIDATILPFVGSMTTPAVSLVQKPSSSKVNEAASGGPSYLRPFS